MLSLNWRHIRSCLMAVPVTSTPQYLESQQYKFQNHKAERSSKKFWHKLLSTLSGFSAASIPNPLVNSVRHASRQLGTLLVPIDAGILASAPPRILLELPMWEKYNTSFMPRPWEIFISVISDEMLFQIKSIWVSGMFCGWKWNSYSRHGAWSWKFSLICWEMTKLGSKNLLG